jgi:hypothetical protein
VEDETESAYS